MKPRTHAGPPRLAVSIMIATVWWFVVLIAILFAANDGNAQAPGSALGAGTTGAPGSSLHGGQTVAPSPNTSAARAPAWTPRTAARNEPAQAPQATPLQQANLPTDLAKLNDNAIIIIGGKPTPAGDVKRGILGLDDKAIITIGGKQVAAGAVKHDLQNAVPPAPTAPAGSVTATGSAASPRPGAPHVARAVTAPSTGTVLGAVRDVQWTPRDREISNDSRVVITGFGFGDKAGSAKVIRNVPSVLPDELKPKGDLTITRWSDTRVEGVISLILPSPNPASREPTSVEVVTSKGSKYYGTVSNW